MHFKSLFIFLIVAVLCIGCNGNKKSSETINPDMEVVGDNSMTSLDWEGTYEGTIPCADCEGIKTAITVNKDHTYVARETYIGKSDSVFESKGTFKWDEKGQTIVFSDEKRNSYFVGENTLTHLDKNNNKIQGDLANRYVLQKVNTQLTGKNWHLVSFKGNEIILKEAKAERPSIRFNEDLSVTGFTACNNFKGNFELKEGQKIKFSQLISTKKFCPELETENQFLKTLNDAAYYIFKDHGLVIHDNDHNLLAEFKVANEN